MPSSGLSSSDDAERGQHALMLACHATSKGHDWQR